MKVKILDRFSYQSFPIVEGMVEVDETKLKDIGYSAQFDIETQTIIPFNGEKRTEYEYELWKISQDLLQDYAGEKVPNIEQKKKDFIFMHNEIRKMLDMPPRELKQ